jgi:hypothetical protein
MKKLLSLSIGLLLTSALFSQAVPNGGFENWNNVTWFDLNGYQSSNDQNVSQWWITGINVTRCTAYHGNYAVQLKTVQVGHDTLFAYVTNSIRNPLQGMGGIPYAQKPAGIRFYYSCNIVSGDTAGVMVIFKKSGSIIGTYLYPFTSNVGTYTLFTNTFSPALAVTPDTMIFAAISSVQAMFDNNNTKGCYPGNLLNIDSITFTGGVTQPANFNGDFENWTEDTMYMPTGWNSEYPGVFQTTDFHAGSYAVQLTTTLPVFQGGSTQAGIISTGPFYNVGPNMGGYPYTQTSDTLEFYYKYTPATAGDSGVVYIELKKSGSPIGGKVMELKPAASYTLQKVSFTSGTTPDSVIVAFASSKTTNPPVSYVGSVLKVDNVFFKSEQSADLGINNISITDGIKIYPNPVINSFNLNTEGFTGSVQSLEVYDLTGRVVLSAEYGSGLKASITSFDMSKTSPGIYIVKVLTSTGVFYQKISKVE